jgi:hypothetical protein
LTENEHAAENQSQQTNPDCFCETLHFSSFEPPESTAWLANYIKSTFGIVKICHHCWAATASPLACFFLL